MSPGRLDRIHAEVRADGYGWLGPGAERVAGSQVDRGRRRVEVLIGVPPTPEMVATARARWGDRVVLQYAPGPRWLEQAGGAPRDTP